MSVKLIDKVFNTNIKGNEKLVLLALADNSNDTGVCFPSYNTLQRKTSMNRGTLAKWIKSLEDKGLILKAKRKRKSGSNSSNKYLLFPNEMFDFLDEEDILFFNQSLEIKPLIQSLEVKLAKPNQSLEVKLESEPSLNYSNRHLYIVEHLNKVCKTNFRHTSKKTQSFINARLNEGFTIDDFKHVHMVKASQWLSDNKMKAYLRPETLYGTKFESYLNETITDSNKINMVQQHTGMSAVDIIKKAGGGE